MTTLTLRPWSEMVLLHPDVEAGALTEAVFAIDLGAIANGDPNVPLVNRDPDAFFRATYLTSDLARLLSEVLAALSGQTGLNRVLKLRTPFGGGKSHTLACLLHAARKHSALTLMPEAAGFADPGPVATAVFDGEKFDALQGKSVSPDLTVRTMWGWIAWQIDPEKAFPLVANHDRDRVAPGGDVIRKMLTEGASGRPVLILLDELLKYMERAAAVPVLESTLQRQAKDFFQNLTVEVSGSTNAALAYSLTWSSRESLGNVSLLEEIDKLAARVDQQREPVSGDEILPILQRRLLARSPDGKSAAEVADAFLDKIAGLWRANVDGLAQRSHVDEEVNLFRARMQAAYPFHPALIDLMRERWTAVEAFQRTRGALRFLASCLHSLKRNGGAQALLGPGDIPIKDADVRLKLLKELGAQNDYDPVIVADIVGPNARARRIDDRLARETPRLTGIKPASRIATAILMYSFGGLRREGDRQGEPLPSGVGENELLAACVGPDLDNITASVALKELRENCLYLHYDGVRYCFKKDPNVTKLIEDAEQEVAREERQSPSGGPVRERIRELLDQRLAGQHAAQVWPSRTQDVPDDEPRFLMVYLPLEFAILDRETQEKSAIEQLTRHGDRPRRYRNGLGLAIPDKRHVEALRRAVRYLMAIDRVKTKKQQFRLTNDQLDHQRERERTENAAVEAIFRELYSSIWLPRVNAGTLELERVERGGRPLQSTAVHDRIRELLASGGIPRVHASVTPRKLAERVRLGEADGTPGIRASEVLETFFRDLHPPRLESAAALGQAILRGVAEGAFAYASTIPILGADNRYQLSPDRLIFKRIIAADEVDFESGFLIAPASLPMAADDKQTPSSGDRPDPPPPATPEPTREGGAERRTRVFLSMMVNRQQVFKAFPAIANLADKSEGGKVTITVEGRNQVGYDETWLRNAVGEPLEEADIKERF